MVQQLLITETCKPFTDLISVKHSHASVIVTDLETQSGPGCTTWNKIGYTTLYESDRTTLLDDSEWLNDNHIACAQNLLKELLPEFCGLESMIKQQARALKPLLLQGLQILHIDGNHWVSASTVNFPHEADIVADVVLYDSMYSTINSQTEIILSELVHINRPVFYVGFRSNLDQWIVGCLS